MIFSLSQEIETQAKCLPDIIQSHRINLISYFLYNPLIIFTIFLYIVNIYLVYSKYTVFKT